MKNQELYLSLVSPSRPYFEGIIKSAIVPLYDGLAGILKNHVSMISELGPGKVTVHTHDGDKHIFFITGGFLEVSGNRITVLANEVYKKQDLEEEKVRKEYENILKIKATGDEEIQIKLQKQQIVRLKLQFSKENSS